MYTSPLLAPYNDSHSALLIHRAADIMLICFIMKCWQHLIHPVLLCWGLTGERLYLIFDAYRNNGDPGKPASWKPVTFQIVRQTFPLHCEAQISHFNYEMWCTLDACEDVLLLWNPPASCFSCMLLISEWLVWKQHFPEWFVFIYNRSFSFNSSDKFIGLCVATRDCSCLQEMHFLLRPSQYTFYYSPEITMFPCLPLTECKPPRNV